MNRMVRAYMLKGSRTVVTDKSLIANTQDSDFTTVSLVMSFSDLKKWAKEVESAEL